MTWWMRVMVCATESRQEINNILPRESSSRLPAPQSATALVFRRILLGIAVALHIAATHFDCEDSDARTGNSQFSTPGSMA